MDPQNQGFHIIKKLNCDIFRVSYDFLVTSCLLSSGVQYKHALVLYFLLYHQPHKSFCVQRLGLKVECYVPMCPWIQSQSSFMVAWSDEASCGEDKSGKAPLTTKTRKMNITNDSERWILTIKNDFRIRCEGCHNSIYAHMLLQPLDVLSSARCVYAKHHFRFSFMKLNSLQKYFPLKCLKSRPLLQSTQFVPKAPA